MTHPWHDVPVDSDPERQTFHAVVERFLAAAKADEVLARAVALYDAHRARLRGGR